MNIKSPHNQTLYAWDLDRNLAGKRKDNTFLEQHGQEYAYVWAENEQEALAHAKLIYERLWEGTQEEISSIRIVGEFLIEKQIDHPSKLKDHIDVHYQGVLTQQKNVPSYMVYRMEEVEEIVMKLRNIAINERCSKDKKFAFVVDPCTVMRLKNHPAFKDCMPGRDFFYVWGTDKKEAEQQALQWINEISPEVMGEACIHIVSEVDDYGKFELCAYSV
ncbi:hypothetical protein AM501_27710 [Aneurinibacillus migulanus]|uniref:Uncharacterized protein n=1 Tax=Aneurinibacillus migulanus TaxID=47500 RepID=A0A0D1Y0L5_ANEMI|nr:hypothetical protein [Aneurinibacillus migulanus]KIV53311.1 hypothetical protein TS64_20290 [Aneurinibacillus migulanus]KIV57873.1 hypothetical protein TS65_08295 [Aneurinibacillus migulanus]KON97370.1 hypothetical protein AF333_19735 [Aneurinibacillus migulanus]KPD05139.1 hypothetical protein AM501_27710 [Aneurinibacillus migulanus]MCP1356360.1 hypothetical protein [Aneurinibacillus migulanus]